MPCYTLVTIEETSFTQQAREALGLPLTGQLTYEQAERVKREAGVLKARASVLRVVPTAVVRRTGNTLTVSVSV